MYPTPLIRSIKAPIDNTVRLVQYGAGVDRAAPIRRAEPAVGHASGAEQGGAELAEAGR